MSKRNSDYVVTEHRDLQVSKKKKSEELSLEIIERYFYYHEKRKCECLRVLFCYLGEHHGCGCDRQLCFVSRVNNRCPTLNICGANNVARLELLHR